MTHKTIALLGNPNVGKSTVFNALTGMKQHTGNWTGKTVALAKGTCIHKNTEYTFVDLPGTYSLFAHSPEEEVARDYIRSKNADKIVIICDAVCLKRNLILVLQTISLNPNCVVCVNLMDEAAKKGIEIDCSRLSEILNIPVVPTAARKGNGLEHLLTALESNQKSTFAAASDIKDMHRQAEDIEKKVVKSKGRGMARDLKIDRILTGKHTGFPIMLCLLSFILWLTVVGANYPSACLSALFDKLYDVLFNLFGKLNVPVAVSGLLLDGVYKVTAWIVSVMLPPMAIFFPLFTILEDLGYLPRIAFNLDKSFQKACACGKQALTVCMGLGCNAVGVTGCRIIDSPRERLIAVLTNSFTPCNGRFPMLITVTALYFTGGSALFGLKGALILVGLIVFSVLMTLIVSRILSHTVLKGVPSSFTLELPPYRVPQVGKVIIRSVLDRTLFVLGRAVCVAAPAGLILWVLAHIHVGGENLLLILSDFLDPLGQLMGLDGAILLAFILGSPANEIVLPILLMIYTAGGTLANETSGTALLSVLQNNGWTATTAISFLLLALIHHPCTTTLLTIYKETKSKKWTFLSVLIPALCGTILCILWNLIARVFAYLTF